MENKQWKAGDWGFFEFELAYIKEMEGQNIVRVGTGHIETFSSSFNDRFFPLDVDIKVISDCVKYWKDKFHRDCKNLNYPDLHRKLVELWCNMISVKDDATKLQEAYDKTDAFGKMVIDKAKDRDFVMVDGVSIFR